MKVVASTKLTRAEKAMREAKKYGGASNGMCRDVNQAGNGSGTAVGGRYVLAVKTPENHAGVEERDGEHRQGTGLDMSRRTRS